MDFVETVFAVIIAIATLVFIMEISSKAGRMVSREDIISAIQNGKSTITTNVSIVCDANMIPVSTNREIVFKMENVDE